MNVAAPKYEEFRMMAEYWRTEEGSRQLADSNAHGIQKVREGKYAFIMETMTAKYLMNEAPCDLETLGEQFATRSYGFALPKGSPYKGPLNSALLALQEAGEVEYLEQKWWIGDDQCWNVTTFERHVADMSQLFVNKPKQINLDMFWGPLVLLVIGIVLTGVIAAVEMLYYKYRGRVS